MTEPSPQNSFDDIDEVFSRLNRLRPPTDFLTRMRLVISRLSLPQMRDAELSWQDDDLIPGRLTGTTPSISPPRWCSSQEHLLSEPNVRLPDLEEQQSTLQERQAQLREEKRRRVQVRKQWLDQRQEWLESRNLWLESRQEWLDIQGKKADPQSEWLAEQQAWLIEERREVERQQSKLSDLLRWLLLSEQSLNEEPPRNIPEGESMREENHG